MRILPAIMVFALLIGCSTKSTTNETAESPSSKPEATWTKLETTNEANVRHENAFVAINDKFYLLGGRNTLSLQVLDPATKTWTDLAEQPLEMHHFQALAFDSELYVLGAFTGGYPRETPIPNIYIYNPEKDAWRKGPAIPEHRLRGAAGVAAYNGKIYLHAGNQDGHWTGHTGWLDVFDPATETWTELPSSPHTRDHYHSVIVNDKLYAVAGRNSSAMTDQVMSLTEPAIDVYDFESQTWSTLDSTSNLPTQRAGAITMAYDNYIAVMGGESTAQKQAHLETELLDTKTGKWISLEDMKQSRHGTQGFLFEDKIYIAAGSANAGGGPELNRVDCCELKGL